MMSYDFEKKKYSEEELFDICRNEELSSTDWFIISQYQKLSENFIREFSNKVDWNWISRYQKLSEDFIKEFQDKVNWFNISWYQELSENFIREFQDKVNWGEISERQELSKDFIEEFKDKIDFDSLKLNEKIKNSNALAKPKKGFNIKGFQQTNEESSSNVVSEKPNLREGITANANEYHNKLSKFIAAKVDKSVNFFSKRGLAVNKDVLTFIYEFGYSQGMSEESYEVLRSTFRAGYCYYFAHMLKLAFGRGECCIAAPFGHMVWVDDDDKIPYDVEGVYDGEAVYFIPEFYLGKDIEDFMHVPGKNGCNTAAENMEIIYNYCENNNCYDQKKIDWCLEMLGLPKNWKSKTQQKDMGLF